MFMKRRGPEPEQCHFYDNSAALLTTGTLKTVLCRGEYNNLGARGKHSERGPKISPLRTLDVGLGG